MSNKRKYPKLYKTLSMLFGARKAMKVLDGLLEEQNIEDNSTLSPSFVFSRSAKGHYYWARKADRLGKGKGWL